MRAPLIILSVDLLSRLGTSLNIGEINFEPKSPAAGNQIGVFSAACNAA